MSTWPSSVSAVGPAAAAGASAAGSVFFWQAVIASATTTGKHKRRYGAVNRDDMWTPSVRTVVSGDQCCARSAGILCPERASFSREFPRRSENGLAAAHDQRALWSDASRSSKRILTSLPTQVVSVH